MGTNSRWAGIAGASLVVMILMGGVIGCRASVSMAPEPEPPPKLPGIVGTWVGEKYRIVDDLSAADPVQVGHGVVIITFTKSRFIKVNADYFEDGSTNDVVVSAGSGGYRIESDAVIVRIDSHVDENDMLVIEETKKAYELVDDDNLNLEPWSAMEPLDFRSPYTRDAAAPPPVVGTWRATSRWERESVQFVLEFTFVFRDDGTYSMIDDYTRIDAEETHNQVQELMGNWQHDPDELFITLTDNTYTGTPPCESDECFSYRDSFAGATLRMAYAPTDSTDRLVLSHFWNEMTRDLATNTWSASDKAPLGHYSYVLIRQ